MYGIPVCKLQRMISSKHFTELIAHYNNNPISSKRIELYLAQIAWIMYLANRDSKTELQPLKLDDFIFKFGEGKKAKKTQSDSDMERQARKIAASYGVDS